MFKIYLSVRNRPVKHGYVNICIYSTPSLDKANRMVVKLNWKIKGNQYIITKCNSCNDIFHYLSVDKIRQKGSMHLRIEESENV